MQSQVRIGESVIDLEDLNKRYMGNAKLVHTILKHFRVQLIADMPKLEESLQNKDFEQLSEQAHALKGAASACSAGPFRSVAEELEQGAKAKDFAKSIENLGLLQEAATECLACLDVNSVD